MAKVDVEELPVLLQHQVVVVPVFLEWTRTQLYSTVFKRDSRFFGQGVTGPNFATKVCVEIWKVNQIFFDFLWIALLQLNVWASKTGVKFFSLAENFENAIFTAHILNNNRANSKSQLL